jgi:hypothetical protein
VDERCSPLKDELLALEVNVASLEKVDLAVAILRLQLLGFGPGVVGELMQLEVVL